MSRPSPGGTWRTMSAGHGGGVLGFRASLLWDMTRERASVVLVNSEDDQTEALNRSLLPII